MLKVFENISKDIYFSGEKIKNAQKVNIPLPGFVSYKEDVDAIKRELGQFQHYQNIIIIGHGGSRTSALAFYHSLAKNKKDAKNVIFLATNDSLYLHELRTKYQKENTLIVVISKSGSTVSLLESLFYFKEYTTIAVTGENSTLYKIAKEKKWKIMPHPDVGGRFSAFTSSGLVPAYLMGLDMKKIFNGAEEMYKQCGSKKNGNTALQIASYLYHLEQNGYSEVFVPIYSQHLSGTLPLIIQLMHESVCKDGKGQTFFGDEAPESQHHSNQRFFGGKKNCVGLFITRKKVENTEKVVVEEKVKDISLGKNKINLLNNLSYEDAFHAEFVGTWDDAKQNKIPCINIEIENISEESIGAFIAFWHYVAVYSAILRDVNPYDQPQVEGSKIISLKERERYTSSQKS